MPTTTLTLPSTDAVAPLLAGAGSALPAALRRREEPWWSHNREGDLPALICSEGLPAPDDFALLLNGATVARAGLGVS